MTYKQWKEKFPIQNFGQVNVARNYKYTWVEDGENIYEDKGTWKIYLEHSCDEWVIGDEVDASKMIVELQEAINYCQNYK